MTAPLYPITEFRRRAFRVVRRGLFTLLAALGTLFLLALSAYHFCDPWVIRDPVRSLVLLWGTLAAAALTLLCEVLWKAARHPLTRCPHCHRPLTDSVPVVVASGCCYTCGKRVLESADAPPAEALIPRADFLTEDARYQRKVGPVVVGGGVATYLGSFVALAVVTRFRMPAPLPFVVFLALLAVAPVCMVAVVRWLNALARRNPALACPGCGKVLFARTLVSCTGNCADCGCRAIVPRTRPLAPPHLGPVWTVPRLKTLDECRRRWARRLVVRVGLIAVVTVGLVLMGGAMWDQGRLRAMGLNPPAAMWAEQFGCPAVGLLGGVMGVVVGRRTRDNARREHPMDCPRCGRELSAAFAVATKCCHRCGWQVVADPTAAGRPHE